MKRQHGVLTAVILLCLAVPAASSPRSGEVALVVGESAGLRNEARADAPHTLAIAPGVAVRIEAVVTVSGADSPWYRVSTGTATGFLPGEVLAACTLAAPPAVDESGAVIAARIITEGDRPFVEVVIIARGTRRALGRHPLPGLRARPVALRLPTATGLSPTPFLVALSYRNEYPLVDGEIFFARSAAVLNPVLSVVYSHTVDERRGACLARTRETTLVFPADPGGAPNRVITTTVSGCFKLNASKKEDFVAESKRRIVYFWDGVTFREE